MIKLFFLTGDVVALLCIVIGISLIPAVIACILVRFFVSKEYRIWWVYLMALVAILVISFFVVFEIVTTPS